MVIEYIESEKDRERGYGTLLNYYNMYGDMRLLLALVIGFWLYALMQFFHLHEKHSWIGVILTSGTVIFLVYNIYRMRVCKPGPGTRKIVIDIENLTMDIDSESHSITRIMETVDDLILLFYGLCFVTLVISKLEEEQKEALKRMLED